MLSIPDVLYNNTIRHDDVRQQIGSLFVVNGVIMRLWGFRTFRDRKLIWIVCEETESRGMGLVNIIHNGKVARLMGFISDDDTTIYSLYRECELTSWAVCRKTWTEDAMKAQKRLTAKPMRMESEIIPAAAG